jgi:hypothetical protein
MPFDTVVVVTVVITAFVAFGLTLAWAHARAH